MGAHLRAAAKSPEDPSAVHDLRVTIRRFGQALRLFPEVFGAGAAKKIKRRLKKMMSLLGEVRNLDIALDVLRAAEAEPDAHLLGTLLSGRGRAQKHLEGRLKSWRKADVIGGWTSLLESRARGVRSLTKARKGLSLLVDRFFHAGNEATAGEVPYQHLHRCRLLGKRLRYTIEMFGAETFDSTSREEFQSRLTALKKLQDHLGGLNDCVTVIALIEGHVAAKNQIARLLARRKEGFRTFWRKRFDAGEQQRWLDSLQVRGQENGTIPTSSRRG
jgi:CHAD domain-containing protein